MVLQPLKALGRPLRDFIIQLNLVILIYHQRQSDERLAQEMNKPDKILPKGLFFFELKIL